MNQENNPANLSQDQIDQIYYLIKRTASEEDWREICKRDSQGRSHTVFRHFGRVDVSLTHRIDVDPKQPDNVYTMEHSDTLRVSYFGEIVYESRAEDGIPERNNWHYVEVRDSIGRRERKIKDKVGEGKKCLEAVLETEIWGVSE